MKKYGTDKPDLRNPLIIQELTDLFVRDDVKFDIFKKLVKKKDLLLELSLQKIQKINQEVFLTTLTNGQKNRVLLD